ncbi:response regulator [Sphingobacterium sp. DN00404]|uniref:histidine kinase n=1 Tax=Sphingobacterium micropteri TaxID=2763501 RepID=A0ABR7YQG0_9SPHI|nr:two-component regulator propeller domain-containing protein [Sphingobacterium micropteri]MBD1433456.1 response regulator [Sphingobacterium micropteri]
MKIFTLTLLLLSVFVRLCSQPRSSIQHYSLQEGLPQRNIMGITQDRKGFIWLGTWDGICKFDGHTFTSYKTSPEDAVVMTTNRVDKILEDKYGYIWLCAYNQETFKFDPRTEKFVARHPAGNMTFKTSHIRVQPSGNVWLTSEKEGAVCVTKSGEHAFSLERNNLPGNKVYSVYEDQEGVSWILTDNGVTQVSIALEASRILNNFYAAPQSASVKMPFFCALETDDEIWFGSGRGKILCYQKGSKSFLPFETGLSSDIVSMAKVYDNLLVILSSKDGFIICDRQRSQLKKVDSSTAKELPTNEMISCFVDKSHNIWLETNSKGLARYNIIEDKLRYYSPNDYGNNKAVHPSFFIVEDKMGGIWTHPHGGFSFYDPKTDRLVPFYNNPLSSEWRFSDMLHNIFQDRQGNLWMSARSGGLEKIVFDNPLFRLNDFYSNKISATGFEVRSFLQDDKQRIWLGSMNGYISVYDANKEFLGFLNKDGSISKSGTPLRSAAAYSFLQDRKGKIWIGTKGNGVYVLTPHNAQGETFHIQQFTHDALDRFSLSHNAVYAMHEDDQGHIWIGTFGGGINLFDTQQQRFINQNNRFANYPSEIGLRIRDIKSRGNKVYVGTTLGLLVLDMDYGQRQIKTHRVYAKRDKKESSLRANDVYDVLVTGKNEVYVATFGGGLAKVQHFDAEGFPGTFKIYDRQNGLLSSIVLSISEDGDQNLWINSEGSLSRFDPRTESFEQFNDVSRAIRNQNFTEASPLLTKEGDLIYGCAHGTLSFSTHQIAKNTFTPYLALTNFKVANQNYALAVQLDDADKVVLQHDQNTFSVEYAALDYADPNSITYAYMLEGFDEDWIYGQQQRIANYTNIPPGEYVFKVRSTNSNGSWTSNTRTMALLIQPSFWLTKWAYFIYIVSFGALLYIIFRSLFVFYRMRDRIKLEQEQAELKTRFFTDISHEIRTPLTMIVSPIEHMLQHGKTHEVLKPQLQLVLRNANRMLKMVNQILDFRKIQNRTLQIREVPVGTFMEELCRGSFQIIADQGVTLVVDNQVGDMKIWVDSEGLEKLAYNLISNAVKHAAEGKRIEVSVLSKENAVALQIRDYGEGMTKDTLSKLFTRFVSFSKDKSKPSTGIGLSIVQEIVDKHHAKIYVDSEVGRGTTFTVEFLLGLDHFAHDAEVEICKNGDARQDLAIPIIDTVEPVVPTDKMSVLVVEDDPDLRTFIASLLQEHYDVCVAGDGKEGYEKTLAYMPDFILSDSMMPTVDGITFLQNVRENRDISHIPFILLTAKAGEQHELEGIRMGADDYITKPFHVNLLIAKIDNILKQRRLHADHLRSKPAPEQTEEVKSAVHNAITVQDELFLQKLQESILEHIDDSAFTIDDLVNSTHLSRRVFFNKIKSLTGLAPVEFVRDIRLTHASTLLKTQLYMIKEVVYMVGFSDVRYFTQCFKEKYQVTPGQYKNRFK